ncbi:MAG: hypothetical protein EP343_09760 [Deltaproteobacteria bacterium]|nr:MAG: hypothetical protein EP343_09760 [Deltaproteobacteria bacterium]
MVVLSQKNTCAAQVSRLSSRKSRMPWLVALCASLWLSIAVGCAPEGNISLKVIPTSGQSFSDASRMEFVVSGDGLEKSPQTFSFDFSNSNGEVPGFAIDPKANNPFFSMQASLFNDAGKLVAFGRSQLPFVSRSVDRGLLVSRVQAFGWLTILSSGLQSSSPRKLVGHQIVPLPDGKMLIVGGTVEMRGNRGAYDISQSSFLLQRLMLYNPQTGLVEFSNAALANPRAFHTATVLPSGKVIIAGGLGFINNKLSVLNSVEVYDPDSDTLRSGNGLKKVRAFHTATLIGDSEIVMVGGIAAPMDPTKRTLPVGQQVLEVEDYVVGESAETSKVTGALRYPVTADGCGPFPAPDKNTEVDGRLWHQTSRLDNNVLLVTGGIRVDDSGNRELPAHAILLKRSGTCWKPEKVETGVTARYEHKATTVELGGLRWAVVTGGRDLDNRVFSTVEVWGSDGRPVPSPGQLAKARYGHASVALPNQKLLILGGIGDNLNAQPQGEVFSLVQGTGGIKLEPVSVASVEGLNFQEAAGRYLPQAAISSSDPRVVILGGASRTNVSDPNDAKEKIFTFSGLTSAELFTPMPSESDSGTK